MCEKEEKNDFWKASVSGLPVEILVYELIKTKGISIAKIVSFCM